MSDQIKILITLASEVVFDQIRPLVSRSNVDVMKVQSPYQALTLARGTPYGLIVVQYPLADLDFAEFFKTLRAPETACEESPLLILTRDDRLDALADYLDGHLVQACLVDAAPEQIQKALSELIGIPMRASVRLGIELAARIENESIQLFCQTVNVSESGVLVRNRGRLPVSTRVTVSLPLPEDTAPIWATGEVVRHTDSEVESVEGLGIRFLDFGEGGQQRLAKFVAELEQETPR